MVEPPPTLGEEAAQLHTRLQAALPDLSPLTLNQLATQLSRMADICRREANRRQRATDAQAARLWRNR